MLTVQLDDRVEAQVRRAATAVAKPVPEFVREAIESRCLDVLQGQPLETLLVDYVGAGASAQPGNSGHIHEVMEEELGTENSTAPGTGRPTRP